MNWHHLIVMCMKVEMHWLLIVACYSLVKGNNEDFGKCRENESGLNHKTNV